jgi:hypothetical protein
MWTPHSLDLPAVGSLLMSAGWGIGLGKATTKDANAPSKKVEYNLDTIFNSFLIGPAESITMQS